MTYQKHQYVKEKVTNKEIKNHGKRREKIKKMMMMMLMMMMMMMMKKKRQKKKNEVCPFELMLHIKYES